MRTLPAAAVPKDAVVKVPYQKGLVEITVSDIENSAPRAGKITWWDEASFPYVVGAADPIEIVSLP